MFILWYIFYMKRMQLPVIDIKKYGGKQVAIVAGKIVGAGDDTHALVKGVKKKFPHVTWREILLVSARAGRFSAVMLVAVSGARLFLPYMRPILRRA